MAAEGLRDLLPCFLVNNLTSNAEEQCKFIIDNDCLEDESRIDYMRLVFCDFGCDNKWAAILLVLFLVIILFLNLSAVADEFLCPNLLTVAKNLRMSDSLAVSDSRTSSCCAMETKRCATKPTNFRCRQPTLNHPPSCARESHCSPSETAVPISSRRLRPPRAGGPR